MLTVTLLLCSLTPFRQTVARARSKPKIYSALIFPFNVSTLFPPMYPHWPLPCTHNEQQHTQQTSFNGSRHQHGRNSINHPGSLQPQISPISVEERLALTKSLDGETLQLTNRKNSSTLTGSSNGSGLGNGNGNGAGNGSPSMLHQHQHGNLHSHHSEQHKDQTLAEDATTTLQEQSVTAPTTMLMIVNKSSNCKIGGT